MDEAASKDPLHGMTLKAILEELVERHGWPALAELIELRCFSHLPSISSSLRFLRKTDWARAKVERLYLQDHHRIERNAKRNRRRAAMRTHRAEQEGQAPSEPTTPSAGPPAQGDKTAGDDANRSAGDA